MRSPESHPTVWCPCGARAIAGGAGRGQTIWLRRAPAFLLGLAALMVAVDEASAAQQRPPRGALYDTSRYLPHTHNECAGAADCQVVASPWRVVRAGRVLGIAVDCPAGKPHVQGWDTRQHEHLQAHLTGYTARGLTVAVRNAAGERGFIRVFVGCSARRSPGNSVMESRVGVPTKVALPRHRGRRDSERAEGVGQ